MTVGLPVTGDALAQAPVPSTQRRSFRADLGLTAASFVAIGIGKTGYFICVARLTDPGSLGSATAVIAAGTLLSIVTAAGVGPAATRTLAAARARGDGKQLVDALRAGTALSTAALIVVGGLAGLAYAVVASDPWFGWNLALFVLTYGVYQFYRSVDYGLGNVPGYLRSEAITNAVLIPASAMALLGHTWLVVPFFLTYGLFIALARRRTAAWMRTHVGGGGTTRSTGAARLTRLTGVLRSSDDMVGYATLNALGTLASMASLQLAVVVTREVYGAHSAGIFSAAYALLIPILYLPRALATALLPRTAADSARDDAVSVSAMLRRLTLLSVGVALPISVLGALAAGPLVTTASGARYAASADILRVLFAASFFLIASVPAVNVLSSRGTRELLVPFWASVAGLAVTVGVWLGAILEPHSDPELIAWGILAGSVVKAVVPMAVAFRRYRVDAERIWACAAIAGVAGIVLVVGRSAVEVAAITIAACAASAWLLLTERPWRTAKAV